MQRAKYRATVRRRARRRLQLSSLLRLDLYLNSGGTIAALDSKGNCCNSLRGLDKVHVERTGVVLFGFMQTSYYHQRDEETEMAQLDREPREPARLLSSTLRGIVARGSRRRAGCERDGFET